MPTLDAAFVRAQFPAFSEPSLSGFCHFENAGGSYACGPVIDRLRHYYVATKVQPKYAFAPAQAAGAEMDRARERMAAWLGVSAPTVHFGPSTTQNVYVLAQAFREALSPGDRIIVTNQDHEANLGAWRRLADDGIDVATWEVDPESGQLDPNDLDALLDDRTRLVAFTACSNVIARHHPVRDWVQRIHDAGAVAVVDGVAEASHGLPNVTELGADVYLFSLYKVFGPHLGVMVLSEELNQRLPHQGHDHAAGNPLARFTPAGPDHAQIAAVNGIFDYLEKVYQHHFGRAAAAPREMAAALTVLFGQHERNLTTPLLQCIDAHPGYELLGDAAPDGRAATIAFRPRGTDPKTLATALGERGLGVGYGHFNAYRLMQALDIDPAVGVVRASMVHYNTAEEVERLIDALNDLGDA